MPGQANLRIGLCVRMQAVSVAVPVAFPGPSLIFMMVYVWSRNFPNNNISLMGLVRRPCVLVNAPCCPEGPVSTGCQQLAPVAISQVSAACPRPNPTGHLTEA